MLTEKYRLSPEAIENKRRYDKEYQKEHYTCFGINISKDEYELFKEILRRYKIPRVKFIRTCMKMLENGKFNLEDFK